MTSDGIYECDVNDYYFLLSEKDGRTNVTMNDWFFWFLQDNDIDPKLVNSVVYNSFQKTLYVYEIDHEYALRTEWMERKNREMTRIRRKHADIFVMKSYPVIHPPSQILMDRWEALMEVAYGNERSLCTTS